MTDNGQTHETDGGRLEAAASSSPARIADIDVGPERRARSERVERLESELRVTRERLRAANEELETSRRKLRSVNEELATVNGELARREQQLTHATSDLNRAEERQRLLLAELQHRVRNTLGVVRSIIRRSAETSLTVADYASHLDGRLNAFARTQTMVTRDPESGVDFEYLVAEELTANDARDGEQLSIAGPAIRLRPKAAETFALALHELATNALKYGALSKPTGRIEIAWRIARHQSSDELIFEWREQGGPRVAPPQRKGYGTEMLERTLAFELRARTSLRFEARGMHCTIIIPLTRHIVHTPAMDGC